MRKWRLFLHFDEEERWLERMAREGWLLCAKSFFYRFEKKETENPRIRMDFIQTKTKRDFEDYCMLFEDSGWKHIAGTKGSGAQYFLRMKKESTEDIFSDEFSRAERYKRLSEAWLSGAIIFLPQVLSLLFGGIIEVKEMFMPQRWYLTPGLWEISGASFWQAFLFETPFALFRGVGCMIPLIAEIVCAAFAMKTKCIYESEKRMKKLL